MDWMVWCLAGEHLRDMEDQHVIWTVEDPHLSDDGLRDSEIQGWSQPTLRQGQFGHLGLGNLGTFLLTSRADVGNLGVRRLARVGRMCH